MRLDLSVKLKYESSIRYSMRDLLSVSDLNNYA